MTMLTGCSLIICFIDLVLVLSGEVGFGSVSPPHPFSVLVNGSTSRLFKASRGLK